MHIPVPVMKASQKVGTWFIKNGPRLMSIGGGAMAIGGAVMACKATLHADEVLDAHRARMAVIEEAITIDPEGYTKEMIRRDKAIVYAETGVAFAKLYGPSVAVGMAGVGLMQGAFGIMDKRHSTTLAALTALDQAYNDLATRLITQETALDIPAEESEESSTPEHGIAKSSEFILNDVDRVLGQEFIPIEETDILESDPFTIVLDARSKLFLDGNQFIYNGNQLESTMNNFERRRSSYLVPAVWVNDIRRAFDVPEKDRGWSYGYSTEPGDSILYDAYPCVYEKVDGMRVGLRPLRAEEGCPEYDNLDEGMRAHIDCIEGMNAENVKRIKLLKQVEDMETDEYCIVVRLLGSGPTGDPAYLRGRVYG